MSRLHNSMPTTQPKYYYSIHGMPITTSTAPCYLKMIGPDGDPTKFYKWFNGPNLLNIKWYMEMVICNVGIWFAAARVNNPNNVETLTRNHDEIVEWIRQKNMISSTTTMPTPIKCENNTPISRKRDLDSGDLMLEPNAKKRKLIYTQHRPPQ